MKPLVSIIIPIYNMEKYLKRCLDSVLAQTYSHTEILLIDDGSTDDSKQIAMAYQDPRIQYFYKENGGQASARNFGLDKMNGKYVIMVDSDDYLHPELITRCLEEVEQTEADLVIFTSYNVNQAGDQQYIPRSRGELILDAGSVPWNKFYLATLWENCRFPDGFWYEDLGIVPVVCLKAKLPVMISDALYYYQVDREDSQSNIQDPQKFLDVAKMLANVEAELEKWGLLEQNRTALTYLYIEHLIYRLVLRKVIYVPDKTVRRQLLKQINQLCKQKIPDWRSYHYQAGGKVTAALKRTAIFCYLHGWIRLGDLIWKKPFAIASKRTGF